MGIDKIVIYRDDDMRSKFTIRVMDTGWADSWTIYYDVEIPHHTQPKTLKKI